MCPDRARDLGVFLDKYLRPTRSRYAEAPSLTALCHAHDLVSYLVKTIETDGFESGMKGGFEACACWNSEQ